MARRFLVSDGSNVKEVTKYMVAQDGEVKEIIRAYVAENGVSRQYYPAVAGDDDKRITWQDNTIQVREKNVEPSGSHATIWFIRSQGLFHFKDYPNADRVQGYMNPPLDGTANDNGKYLIRLTKISGTNLSPLPSGLWEDLNANSQYLWELIQDGGIVGLQLATYTISIAADDGAGNPVATTQVNRTVNFETEVLAASDIGWDATQRDLVEIKEGETADCSLTFDPLGLTIGDADTSGAFNEQWLRDGGDPTGMTVQVNLISGTAPTGTSLGVALPLDQTRQWILTAQSDENLSCALDVIVADAGASITKRITMNSQFTLPPTSTVWTTTQWQFDDLVDGVPSGATVSMGADGVGIATRLSSSAEVENENWHSQAPTPSDPQNYEIKLTHITGFENRITGSPIGVWLKGDTSPSWDVSMVADAGVSSWYWDVSVRRIGGLTVDKRVIITLGRATDDSGQPIDPNDPPDIGDGNIPPGGSIP